MVSGPTLIRPTFGHAPSPFFRRGEGFRAARCAAPTAENGPGTLVRRRQAQKRNRTSSNFLPAQAPSGAGRNRAQALLILRAGNVLPTSRGNPRNGGPGADSPCQGEMSRSDRGGRVGEYGHEVSILSRPPAILKVNCPEGAREGGLGHWVLSHRWESTSPRRAKPSCNRRKGSITAPSSAPFGGTFPPGGRLKKSRRRNPPHRSKPTSTHCPPTLSLPCKPTVSKTKTAGWWRAARPSARLTGRR